MMTIYGGEACTVSESVISIIVPVYKVEAFLPKCVESIINQTYKSLEILLIDDGSPDSCGALCEKYAQQDRRVKAFHTENNGLSAARNLGIQEATGDYIGFVDSDDWIEPDMYEVLLRSLIEADADICECGLWNEYYDHSEIYKMNECDQSGKAVYDTKESLCALIEEKITNPVWNKLYKKKTFEEIVFPEGRNYEDVFCMHKILGNCKRVTKISTPKYHYRQRDESISHVHTASNLIDYAEACLERREYLEKNDAQQYREKEEQILGVTAAGLARVWRWWYACDSVEKGRFAESIQSMKQQSKELFPLIGYKSWPLYLRLSGLFMRSSNKASFLVLFYLNQMYRRLSSKNNSEKT